MAPGLGIATNPLAKIGIGVIGIAGAGAAIGALRSEDTGIPISKTLVSMGTMASIGAMIAGGGIGMNAVTKPQFVIGHLGFYGGAVAPLALGVAMLHQD
jgi:hypothetical protein